MFLVKWSNCSTYWSIHHFNPKIASTLRAHQRSRSINVKYSTVNNLLLGRQSVYKVNIFIIYDINDVIEDLARRCWIDCHRKFRVCPSVFKSWQRYQSAILTRSLFILVERMKWDAPYLFNICFVDVCCSSLLCLYIYCWLIFLQRYIPMELTDPHMLCVQNLIFPYAIVTSWQSKKYDLVIFE